MDLSREQSKNYVSIQIPECLSIRPRYRDWKNQNLYSAPTVTTLVFAETVEPTLYVS
jgi:hypothetical protein